MAGLGLLFSALSGGGKALAASAEQEQRVADESRLMEKRAQLEEEKTLRIAEATRVANRQAALTQGREISEAAGLLSGKRNQADADRINAENADVIGGSSMSAADAATLRNAPEAARKAYGLLSPSRQTDLEDRATAEENLGYDSKGTRALLQTEVQNQRNKDVDESTNRRLDMEEKRFDAQERRAAQQLSAQISHWKAMESKSGGDPATQALAKMKLAEFQMQSEWHAELAKTPVGSPEREALMQKGRDFEWIKDAPSDVTTSVKRIDAEGNEVTTTTKGRASSAKPDAGPTQDKIALLRANPDKASDFDAKYGKGMAAKYLKAEGGKPATAPNPVRQDDRQEAPPKPVKSAAQIRGALETRPLGRGQTGVQYKNPKTGAWVNSIEEATK